MRIKPLKSLAIGFFGMTAIIALFCILTLFQDGDAWIALLYLLILAIPLSGATYLFWNRKRNSLPTSAMEKLSNALFSLLGVALACWAYDLTTTFYAINIARVATEINPLGWPLGAAGALSYYAPTVVLTYILLFKLKARISQMTAVPITAVSLFMGSMNLNAGAGNFTFFVSTVSLSDAIRSDLLAVVLVADLTCIIALAIATSRKRLVSVGKPETWKSP